MSKRKRQRAVTLGFELPEGEPPTEFRIFPYGELETTKGNYLFDEAAAEAVLAWAKEWGNKFSIDYNHQQPSALEGVTPTGEAPAAGWFDLELRTDGLWAVAVEWTEDAAEALGKREYRYFSPWLDYEVATGRVMRLYNLALTNLPATQDLEAIVAGLGGKQLAISWRDLDRELLRLLRTIYPGCYVWLEDVLVGVDSTAGAVVYQEGESDDKWWHAWRLDDEERVILEGNPVLVRTAYVPSPQGGEMETVMTALGLSKDASEASALEAVQALGQRAEVSTTLATLTGKEAPAEALGVIQAWKESHDRVADVEAQLATVESEREEAELAALIDQGIEDGKLEPTDTMKAWAREQGVAGLQAYLGATQPKVKTQPTKQPGEGADQVTLSQAVDEVEAEWQKVGRTYSADHLVREATKRHPHLGGE